MNRAHIYSRIYTNRLCHTNYYFTHHAKCVSFERVLVQQCIQYFVSILLFIYTHIVYIYEYIYIPIYRKALSIMYFCYKYSLELYFKGKFKMHIRTELLRRDSLRGISYILAIIYLTAMHCICIGSYIYVCVGCAERLCDALYTHI